MSQEFKLLATAEDSVLASPLQDCVCSSPDDEYQCSECFGMYKEDKEMENWAEWVRCDYGQ